MPRAYRSILALLQLVNDIPGYFEVDLDHEEVFGVQGGGDNRRYLSNGAMENNDTSVAGSTSLTVYRWPGLCSSWYIYTVLGMYD